MHMRPYCWGAALGAALFLALPPAIWADTLILKDGQAINGHYLSSDADSVQFEVNGKPFRYAVWLIRELRFSSAAGQPEVRSAGLHGKEHEQAFCQVLRDFQKERQRLTSEPNPIRRAQMQPPDPWTFESRVAAVFGPSGEFTNWTGRLFFTVSGSIVSINFAPACPPGVPTVGFTNGYPTDRRAEAAQALIDVFSPLAQELSRKQNGF